MHRKGPPTSGPFAFEETFAYTRERMTKLSFGVRADPVLCAKRFGLTKRILSFSTILPSFCPIGSEPITAAYSASTTHTVSMSVITWATWGQFPSRTMRPQRDAFTEKFEHS